MTRVTLVRVDATMRTVRATAGFLDTREHNQWNLHLRDDGTYGSLLHDNVLDVEILELEVFRIGVRLGILEETEDELDGLLGPTTFPLP